MRIAQIAPLIESVPPRGYGGTERVVHYLTEELVRRGHAVTLFASADSRTSARHVPVCETSLRLAGREGMAIAYNLAMLEKVFAEADDFDVLHFHIDSLQFPFLRRKPVPNVTTLHGRLDLPELEVTFGTYPEMPVVSISEAQRRPLPWLNWQATIYHGLPLDLLRPSLQCDDYLLFLGRICAEKGTAEAIEIALRAGRRLIIAAKVDRADVAYFEEVIRPRLAHPLIEYIGEVADEQKSALIGGALGVLLPINWPEPFGIVMIESFACGTPVIAFRHGSVPEVMREGVSGFIVSGVEEAVEAVDRLPALGRAGIRRYFEERFSVARMADDHLALYERLLEPAEPAWRRNGPARGRRRRLASWVAPYSRG